jgi:branched-subunit amino acid aminotransferase/4-amino-4-deoxychorismate lyase
VLALATEHGIPAREAAVAPADLAKASEAFLTNSLLEVLPVTRLQDRALPEGPVTAKLARLYRESIARP